MILVIKCARIVLNFIYLFFKLLPTKNKITMISRQSNKPSQEFEMIRDKIVSFTSEVEVVMLCHTLDGGIKSKTVDRIRSVSYTHLLDFGDGINRVEVKN